MRMKIAKYVFAIDKNVVKHTFMLFGPFLDSEFFD